MSLKSKTISGIKWTGASTFFLALIGLIKISVLARFLHISDFGLMALVSFVLGFMELFMDMGLTSAILHKQDISNYEYGSLYWINIFFSLILFLFVCLISPFISSFYNEPELKLLIPLMAISIILSALGRQFKTIKQKHLNFKYIAYADTLGALVGLVVGLFSSILGYGVYALVYSALIQYSISNGIYLISGIRENGIFFRFKFKETVPYLKLGIYQVGGQIINYLNRDLDILIIGKFFGPEILGGYSLAKQLVQRPSQIINPVINKVATPVLAIVNEDKEKLKNQFFSFLNITITANFIAYCLLGSFANLFVLIFYGDGFKNITTLVQLLSLYMFIRSVGDPVGSVLTATGRTDLDLYWNLFVLVITPITVYIGANFSIEMVALSLIIIMLGLFYPAWKFLIYKLVGGSFREYLGSCIPSFRKSWNFLRASAA